MEFSLCVTLMMCFVFMFVQAEELGVAEKVGDRPTSKIKPPFMISGPFGIFDNIRAKVM